MKRPNRFGADLDRVGSCLLSAVFASSVAFFELFRLRDDPLPALGDAYRIAASLQPLPYLVALVVALLLRRQRLVVEFLHATVVGCGLFGWWRIHTLADTRELENEPVTRNAIGNIAPDAGGYLGVVEVFTWPILSCGVIGLVTLLV